MSLEISPTSYKKGECFICGDECHEDFYAHHECADAFEMAKHKRIRDLMNKYGDGLFFERKLLRKED